jgi:hypothetical protein
MSEKKYYVVGVNTPEVWDRVHEALTQDGTLDDNIPPEAIECTDLKEHSPTRSVYLMTDEEADLVRQCSDVKFVNLDISKYPELYPPNPDEMRCSTTRYNSTVKNYRGVTSVPTSSPTSAELNRAGYEQLRCAQYANPWQGQSVSTVIANTIPITNTGKNVDVIVGDEGCWFGHVEFQSNPSGNVALPNDFVGGNKLPGNGTCNLLDVVLEGPYYIDSAWFDASPGTRLATRWDGTIVPVESVAREWWGNSSARSSQFSTAGTVAVPSTYTRINCNGTNTTVSTEGDHGTPCSGQAFGRTFGWAYNANKWFIDAYGSYGFGLNVDLYFDVMKIFHLNKPVNPLYGTRDPTISSNSWGFRETTPSTGYYYFRQDTSGSGGVAYASKPAFMAYIGSAGDSGRCKGEMLDNNLTTAGDELVASGVIFVVAAGNSNQKQVGSSDADFNNYWATAAATPLASATHTALDGISTCYNTTSRRGFPQQLGKYSSGGQVVYPAINIGALDDDAQSDGKERKVNYSDMGSQIDCYSPGDGTLSSAHGTAAYGTAYPRYDTYANAVPASSGFSGICSTSALLTTTGTFSVVPNTGNQITTSTGAATVVSIASSLFGGGGLSSATTPTSGNNDDGYWTLSLPFNVTYNGTSYNSVYIGTNSYLTFGAGSSAYASLSASNPALPKIMISAADNSAQRIYYGAVGSSPNRTYRVRWEGTNATTGTLGSPNMVWEATFYENTPNKIDIQIGVNAKNATTATFYDTRFSGTSSACPTATGLIATALEVNRSWGWPEIRTWLQSLTDQSATTFYQGPDPTTATSADWADLNSLMGGTRKVLYNNVSAPSPTTTNTVTVSGGLIISGSGLRFSFS